MSCLIKDHQQSLPLVTRVRQAASVHQRIAIVIELTSPEVTVWPPDQLPHQREMLKDAQAL